MPWWGWLIVALAVDLAATIVIARGIGLGSGCTCRKHAWDPGCPRHGLGVDA